MAIGISMALYISLFLLIGSVAKRDLLVTDFMATVKMAWPLPEIAKVGVLIVGVGSAFQCLRTAARVVHSLAEVAVLPGLRELQVDKLSWSGEPRRAVGFTCLMVAPFIFVPEVEYLAVFVTMCFLLNYGSTNFACFLLSIFQPLNWRPRFHYHHKYLSLIGVLYCTTIMLELHWPTALISILASILVSYYIQVHSEHITLGMGVQGLLFHLAVYLLAQREWEEYRESVRKLRLIEEEEKAEDVARGRGVADLVPPLIDIEGPHGRVWRPQILAIVRVSEDGIGLENPRLMSFISQLRTRTGLCILASIVTTKEVEEAARQKQVRMEVGGVGSYVGLERSFERSDVREEIVFRRRLLLWTAMRDEGITGFTKVFTSPSVRIGQSILLQTVGLGELTPNTVVLSWPSCDSRGEETIDAVRRLQELWFMTRRAGYSSIICKGLERFPSNKDTVNGSIDVWWIVQEGQLQLLLAYILQQHFVWKNCDIRLFTVANTSDDVTAIENELRLYLRLMHIPVSFLEVVALQVIQPRMQGSLMRSPTPDESGQVLAGVLQQELDEEDHTLQQRRCAGEEPGPSNNGSQSVAGEPRSNNRAHSSSFVKTWIHDVHDLPNIQRRDLFLKAHTVATLKREIDARSATRHTALVILNLPAPEVDTNLEGLSNRMRAGLCKSTVVP
ncbi:hypothetical protein HK104_010494 [Borealophlyctis nickersoniae]|nr:hypothetical protein HK104_010494 [Borealophlyctis nickersoniae]